MKHTQQRSFGMIGLTANEVILVRRLVEFVRSAPAGGDILDSVLEAAGVPDGSETTAHDRRVSSLAAREIGMTSRTKR